MLPFSVFTAQFSHRKVLVLVRSQMLWLEQWIVRFLAQVRFQMTHPELRQRMHQPIPEQGTWLRHVVTGFFAYHAVPTNFRALGAFRLLGECGKCQYLRRRRHHTTIAFREAQQFTDLIHFVD